MENELIIATFIPKMYEDTIDKSARDIPDTINLGFYRFYGIYDSLGNQLGFIKYHIMSLSPEIEIDRIKIEETYREKGYGTFLLKESLTDLISDYPDKKNITVCSSPRAISFYIKNDFTPYFGDNNLKKELK